MPLFGVPAQSSSSLFGAPAQSSASLFGAPTQSSASLFGTPAQGTSLFGQPTSAASLFGQSSSSLYGAPATGASIFGFPSQQPQPQSLWGQSQPQLQQTPSQEITGRTRISQLPQNFQTDLFAVERHLREQRTKAAKLWTRRANFESEIAREKGQAANIARRLVRLRACLESLRANSDALKAAVRTERASAEPVVLALENYIAGYGAQVGLLGTSDSFRYSTVERFIGDRTTRVSEEYFFRLVEELEARSHEYKGEIDEIAEYLRAQGVVLSRTPGSAAKQGVGAGMHTRMLDNISQRHADAGISASDDTVASRGKTIEDVIRRQYEYFMVVASHVAGVHENLRSIREEFLRLLRARDPDVLDPFQQANLREKAERDRQRLIADKRALEETMGFGINPSTASSQNSLLQIQSSGFAMSSNAFGSSGQTSGFGTSTSFGNALNGGINGSNGSQNRRTSSGRRKRS